MRWIGGFLTAAACVTTLGLNLGFTAIECSAASPGDDSTIRPGIGIGIVKLGMNRDQITRTLGKRDGKYSLPGNIKVEYSQWKDPDKTMKIRVFFDEKGKVVQLVSEQAPVPTTQDGISIASTLADVKKKYKSVQRLKYHANVTNIDYYDDVKRGIAFKFAGTDLNAKTDKPLDAIVVHLPGRRFIADTGEKPGSAGL
jgi:hypothetical protein